MSVEFQIQCTKRIEEFVHVLMQLKVLQFQGVWEEMNPPREEETSSEVGTKLWKETAKDPEFTPDKAIRTC